MNILKKNSICFFLLLLCGSLSAQLPTSGLVAHYAFNNDVTDASGNNNNAQISGGVTTAEDRFKNPCGAMRFNGADGFITVPNAANLKSPASSFSLSVWFKLEKNNSASNDLNVALLAKGGNGKLQYSFSLARAFGNSYSDITLGSDATFRDENYNAHPLETEQWYFLTVVYEDNWVNVFLNNKVIAQSIIKKPFSPNDLNLEIGRVGAKYFSGSLDDLRIYNRGLSPFEITALFNEQPAKESADNITNFLPKNIEKNTEAGKCSAAVEFQLPSINSGCGKIELKQIAGSPSGSQFEAGKNEIVFESTSGNKITDSFSITIFDKENPVIKCIKDTTVSMPFSSKGVQVDYAVPIATDNCKNANVELISGNKSGEIFSEGTTTIHYKATDAAGNSAECSFKITVEKTVQRTLHCAEDVIAFTRANSESAQVNYTAPYVDVNEVKTAMKKTKGLASGSQFPIGKNEIVYEFTDTARGNLTCTFNVIVRDTIAPTIICPPDIHATTEAGKKSVAINYSAPKVIDNGKNISAKLISGFASGTEFPAGTTLVKYEASDEWGNKSECSFNVIVEEKRVEETKISQPTKTDVKEIKPTDEKNLAPSLEEKEQTIKQIQKPFVPPVTETKTKTENKSSTENFPVDEAKPTVTENSPAKDKVKEAEKAFFPDEEISKPRVVAKEETHDVEPKPIEKPSVTETKTEEKKTETKTPDTAPAPVVSTPIILECVEDIVRESDPGKCGTVVKYNAPFVRSGVGVNLMQTKGNASGSFFKSGTTVNTFEAKDVSGKMKECSFNIIVKESEPPVFNCPHDTTITLPVNRRGIVYYYKDPEVKDNCGLDTVIMETGSKNGCFLEVGVHPFIYKAIDASGNYQVCTHSVIIKTGAPAVKNELLPKNINAALNLGSDSVNYEYKAEMNDCVLTAFIYDDGEEDNDTVSIIFNGQVIVNREMIRVKEHKIIKRTLALDEGNDNYIISKAWNTGKFGLNTLRMDIYEGDIENEKKDLKDKKPVMSKVIHSKPGVAGGIILKCK